MNHNCHDTRVTATSFAIMRVVSLSSNPLSRPSIFQKTSNLLCRERKLSILLCHGQMLSNPTTQLSFYIILDMFPWTDFFATFSQCPKSPKILNALISGLFRLSRSLRVTLIPLSPHVLKL